VGIYHFFKGQEADSILTFFSMKHPHRLHCLLFTSSGQALHISNLA